VPLEQPSLNSALFQMFRNCKSGPICNSLVSKTGIGPSHRKNSYLFIDSDDSSAELDLHHHQLREDYAEEIGSPYKRGNDALLSEDEEQDRHFPMALKKRLGEEEEKEEKMDFDVRPHSMSVQYQLGREPLSPGV